MVVYDLGRHGTLCVHVLSEVGLSSYFLIFRCVNVYEIVRKMVVYELGRHGTVRVHVSWVEFVIPYFPMYERLSNCSEDGSLRPRTTRYLMCARVE
jgi:hypothetical protein